MNCIESDDQGDYYLIVNDRKQKKSYLLPISDACIKAIRAQQELINSGLFKNKLYLFAGKSKTKSPHMTARSVNRVLTTLACKHRILDVNGNIWKFHTHQFRHTVGTRMINAGVPQTIVQKYLGHESPEMTARYAHIHDETLKAAFNGYQGKLVDINGKNASRTLKKGYHVTSITKWLVCTALSTTALPTCQCMFNMR